MGKQYIDADKLLRDTIYNTNHVPYIAESDIIFAPKVDAVEVVRCKNCNKRNGDYCHRYHDGYSAFIHQDDFCSNGERRNDE